MKKTLTTILALVLILLPMQQTNASFPDVDSSHSNSDAINYVQAEGIVNGYSDGTYKPDQTINRAEFTKIIIGSKYSTDEISACTPDEVFSDVDPFQVPWIYQYSCTARNEGIINGYSDGTFKPFQEISFIEAAKIIANTFGYDIPENDIWYKPFVEKLSEEKAIPTSIDGLQKNITRGEMAEMVYRLKAGVKDKETVSYEDLNNSNWQTYTNEEYGFNLTFPVSWEDFTVKKETLTEENSENVIALYFGLPAQDELFAISIMSKSLWTAMQNEEGPKDSYLNENSDYVFSYSQAQYAANDDIMNKFSDIPQIAGTFQFIDEETREVDLYYHNLKEDEKVYDWISFNEEFILPIKRYIPLSKTPIKDTFTLLFEGKLTDEEINQGFNTGPLNTYDIKMKSIVLTDGVLKISFEDNVLMESLSSAQSSVFYTSIKKTAQQFPEIKKVVLLSNEENGYDVTLNIETEYGDIYLVSTLIDDMTGDLSRYMEAVKIELDSSAQTIEDKISLSLQKLFDIETLEYGQSGYQNLLYESDLNVVDVVTVDGTTEVKISGSLIGSGSVANVFIPMQITETIEQYTDNYIIKLNDSEQAWRCAFDTTGSCI